jgi:penicillin-binding protein 1C
MTRMARAGAYGAAACIACVLGLLLVPVPDPLFDDPKSSVLVASDGSLLGARIAADGQWRFPAGPDVPDRFETAITTYEDRRFRWHPGIDPLALARAAFLNAREGEIVSGGSTLTMQVARMARGRRQRTYGQKLVEVVWSLTLEIGHSKDEVLAMYAANAPFGGNVVGLEAAAWRYFGRPPAELSWAETAMLAVLPNSPGLIHPGRNRDRLRERRDGLLRALHEAGTLDETELRLALLERLPEEPVPLPRAAPHLLETLVARNAAGPAREPAAEGRRFESTLDRATQRMSQRVVEEHARALATMGIDNAAVLVVDNRSFDVLGYVGNSRWSVDEGSGFAIDLVYRPRSTGSVLKPLLFARMLDAGELLPSTLVPDVPSQFAGYMPENYDRVFRGAVPARDALARSLNVPAVWMLSRHGVDKFYDFLERMGMSTLHRQPQGYGLTLVLGGAEGTLWDLTTMYANVAHVAEGGRVARSANLLRPRLVISDEIDTGRPAGLSVGASWLTLDALKEVVRPGVDAQWRRFEGSHEVAWKTGTSYGHRDAWAIGSTARYTVGVWVGNASGEGRPELTGVGSAAPLLFDVFNGLERVDWGPRPEFALRSVAVCRDDGYLAVLGCETEEALAPRDSHFERPSPYHRVVHLADGGAWQVDARCEPVDRMTHETWFVLPPGQEHYYRQHRSGYRPLPPVRPDCQVADGASPGSMDFLYPEAGTAVYIPWELGGERGRVVFAVAHRRTDARLYWHLDDHFVGSTVTFHEQALDIPPGRHTITVVDQWGGRASRAFEVLDKDAGSGTVRAGGG